MTIVTRPRRYRRVDAALTPANVAAPATTITGPAAHHGLGADGIIIRSTTRFRNPDAHQHDRSPEGHTRKHQGTVTYHGTVNGANGASQLYRVNDMLYIMWLEHRLQTVAASVKSPVCKRVYPHLQSADKRGLRLKRGVTVCLPHTHMTNGERLARQICKKCEMGTQATATGTAVSVHSSTYVI